MLAEPNRREIVSLIWDTELAAGQIAERFPVSFAAISQHLAVLRDARLVTIRRDGRRRLYSANREEVIDLVRSLESMWSASLDRLTSVAEAEEDAL